jgi:transcriptional regulator with XRE-family HTH domain
MKLGKSANMAISGNQLRAARALADVGQRQLAKASKVSVNTIRNMEARKAETVRVRRTTMQKIRKALKQLNVVFLKGRTRGRGVQLLS